jgi:hypothetical protein
MAIGSPDKTPGQIRGHAQMPALIKPAGLRGFIGAESEKWAPIITASGVLIE